MCNLYTNNPDLTAWAKAFDEHLALYLEFSAGHHIDPRERRQKDGRAKKEGGRSGRPQLGMGRYRPSAPRREASNFVAVGRSAAETRVGSTTSDTPRPRGSEAGRGRPSTISMA